MNRLILRLKDKFTNSAPVAPNTPYAAVAIILRKAHPDETDGPSSEDWNQLELLLIKRAEHPSDPWSGHMAFPGGRHDAEDELSLWRTAIRETHEELGFSLDVHAERLGTLQDVTAMARGQRLELTVRPHVFALNITPDIRPNSEVAEVVWVKLGPLLRGAYRDTMDYNYHGQPLILPAHRVGKHVIWGLTYQMLEQFLLWFQP